MAQTDLELARKNMILQQIRPWDVHDERVLDVLTDVPRENFAPEQYRNIAFTDTAIPLAHDQHMLHPILEGRILQTVDVQATDEVLEIGTGTGFLTACLAKLGKSVTTVDLYSDFIDQAKTHLQAESISNVTFKQADATQWSDTHEYDVIVIGASMPEYDPRFEPCLKEGGRLFVVVGTAPNMDARLLTKINGEIVTKSLFETVIAALQGTEKAQKFAI